MRILCDLAKSFKAENWDPAYWADLMAKSGAKYAGICAVHHDGYCMWDSEITDFCAGKLGPKRDLYGDLVKEIRKRVKNTKLQMLIRGQNLVGYKYYPDDVVDKFIQKSVEYGNDIFRVLDALNDIRNIEQAVKSINKYNAHCQCAIAYTTSEVHTLDYYVDLAKQMEAMVAFYTRIYMFTPPFYIWSFL